MTLHQTVTAHFSAAEAELRGHLVSHLDSRCRKCGEMEPCPSRREISALFARHGYLPRRIPGQAGVVYTHRLLGSLDNAYAPHSPGSGERFGTGWTKAKFFSSEPDPDVAAGGGKP